MNSTPPIARWLYGWAFALACALMLYLLRGVLTPVLTAFGLAYLLDPLVDRFEAIGVPRSLGIAILLVAALSLTTLGVLLVLPSVIHDVSALINELPRALSRVIDNASPWLRAHNLPLPRSGSELVAALEQHVKDLAPDAMGLGQSVLSAALGSTASALSAIVGAVIVPVLAFHLLRDFDLIVAALVEFIPNRQRVRVVALGREVNLVLHQFVRGQLMVMAILAALYALGYSIAGVHLAIPIGLVGGLFSFIPYVGSGLSIALALLMTALHYNGTGQVLGVIAVYAIVQGLEGFVITPRIVGEKLGLAPVWVLIALMAGGELFGFLGVMLALPAAAVVKVFAMHGVRRYLESNLFEISLEDEAPARPGLRRIRRARRRRRMRARAAT